MKKGRLLGSQFGGLTSPANRLATPPPPRRWLLAQTEQGRIARTEADGEGLAGLRSRSLPCEKCGVTRKKTTANAAQCTQGSRMGADVSEL